VTELAAPRERLPRTTSRGAGPPAALLGMLVFIASEGTLFLCLVATYFYLRFLSVAWPPDGIPKPRVVVPLVLLAVLVATALPMHLVTSSASAGRVVPARLWLLLALVVQCVYFAYEAYDFHHQLRRVPIGHDAYTSIYYVLLGADHAHVLVGILFNLWLLGKLARGLTPYRVRAARAIAWYWYAVVSLTVLVFGTLLSAHL
jgi:cytochrome c oxidase subunit III